MRPFKLTQLYQFIGLSLFSSTLLAFEQPTAESLVGKVYLGGHGMYMKTDEDRLLNGNINSSIDHASGLGGELGYRASEFFETRMSYTHFKPVAELNNYDVPSGSSTALDLLYFPYKESFYVVGGADFLDVEKSDLSVAGGAGYRHYLSRNMALYFEGKGHYQLDDKHTDFSSKIGFVYFFGTEPKKVKPKPVPVVAPVAVLAPKDSDKDGVIDSKDDCPNTPETDKVDDSGCTIFFEKIESIPLSVNFDNNKAIVKDVYKSEIAKVATFMNKYPHVNVSIDGHTSALGSAEYNQRLSEKRAQAIVDILVNEFTIEASRLKAVGHGENQLLDKANTAEAHKLNRRIEAHFVARKQVSKER
jgi:OOP family OmpA-OmpF porin